MSRFYFGGSDSEDSDETALPYPKPLARSAFLTADFLPTSFLSSLHNRHQTLEDLRVELRTRKQELNKELLDLVNDNYQDFLGLGSSLKGGEGKIEEVRLGLLRFRREVDGLRDGVARRREEVEGLFEERKRNARELRRGKALLEVNMRLGELEEALRIGQHVNGVVRGDQEESDFTESDDSEDELGQVGVTISTTKLRRRVQQYLDIKRLIEKIGATHPFLVKQEDRISKIRQTLLLDLKNALVESRKNGASEERFLRILALYKDLDESSEALSAVRERRN